LKDIQFHAGNIPEGFQLNFSRAIFNRPEHLRLQSFEGWHSFYILNDTSKKVEAGIFFHVQDYRAVSPLRAPFGSIEFSEAVSLSFLYEFIGFFEKSLRKMGVREIVIKNPPTPYHAERMELLQVFLQNSGYQILTAEPGACIIVSDESFESRIHTSQKQLLVQCRKADLHCKQLSVDQLPTIYTFISKHLTKKGYKLSMAYDDLQNTVDVFAAEFFLFAVFDDKKMIAASISIQVTEDVLYNFYIAHDADYNSLSPAVMVIEALYQYCQKSKIRLLDLGTSALDQKPNFSLLDFKLRLGAEVTAKLSFNKRLN
jgi:hypothetical protein